MTEKADLRYYQVTSKISRMIHELTLVQDSSPQVIKDVVADVIWELSKMLRSEK